MKQLKGETDSRFYARTTNASHSLKTAAKDKRTSVNMGKREVRIPYDVKNDAAAKRRIEKKLGVKLAPAGSGNGANYYSWKAVRNNEPNTNMKLDLTTAESALAYLRSLPADQAISLPGHYTESTTEGDAVRAIVGESAHTWAGNRRQWEWSAADLVATLEAEIADREGVK